MGISLFLVFLFFTAERERERWLRGEEKITVF